MTDHFFDGDDQHLDPVIKERALALALKRGGQTTPVSSYDIDYAREIVTGEVNEVAKLRERLTDAYNALRSIAEGNLGDMPWQANYDTIRTVARNALPEDQRSQ